MKYLIFLMLTITNFTWVVHWDPIDQKKQKESLEFSLPIHTKRERVFLIPAWEDLLSPEIPIELIDEVFGVMNSRPDHLFIICTRNEKRLRWEFLNLPVYLNVMILTVGEKGLKVKERVCGVR